MVMRVAALYDIHGNLPALEAVLGEVREEGVEQIVVGGDVVPGPMPGATLDRLLDLAVPTLFIHGNGERDVLARMSGREPGGVPELYLEPLRWSASQLLPEHERRLARWPPTCRVHIEPLGDVLFCHATPRSDNEIITRRTPAPALIPLFEGLGVRLIVCGHTHMQFDRRVGDFRVVNAGSVGMPFGNPGAYWLLLGADVELRCTAYDLAEAAHRIRKSRYPDAEEFSRGLMEPASEAEMLEIFERAALKNT